MADEGIQREVLPARTGGQVGLMTFKATDPDTAYPQYAANLGIESGTGGG
jgi:hypothetical protein